MHVDMSYLEFDRMQWRDWHGHLGVTLTEEELINLRSLNDRISIKEVEEVYLPLAHLIHLYVQAAQQLHKNVSSFLSYDAKKVPFVIGIAGSVAVGKSTTARILQALLSRFDQHRNVALITTDGFLYPNHVLEKKGIMNKKGFPESYDTKRLIAFMADAKAGKENVEAPVYSHLSYDILPDECIRIENPDILIVEGINVLQVNPAHQVFVSDFFDFSLYVDADDTRIKNWYVERFLMLQKTAFQNPQSYFHRYISLTEEEAVAMAKQIWKEINAKNLYENILPTKGRAQAILYKGDHHEIEKICFRKL